MREKPAVVYPASNVDSLMVRADMESAASLRQSLRTASVRLPDELSASSDVGVSLVAMMGDQSLRKGGRVKRQSIHRTSGRHRVGRIVQFLSKPSHTATIALAVTQSGITNAGQLVGQSAGCLVMVGTCLNIERPLPQRVDLSAGSGGNSGCSQYRPGAMDEQHAQVAVSLLGEAPEMPGAAGGMLLRRQTEPAGEMPGILEVGDAAAGGGDHRGGRKQANAGDRQQGRTGWRLFGQCRQLAFKLGDARFQQAHLFDQQLHAVADQCGDSRIGISQHAADLFQAVATASRNGNTEFPTETAQGIDTCCAGCHPEGTNAVQALQGLLLDGFDSDRCDIGTASCFEQGAGVGRVSLVAPDIGADVRRGQQFDLDAQRAELPCPVVRRAAGFHNNQRDVAIDKPAFELAAGKAMMFGNAPAAISHSKLEYGFGQVNGHDSSIHGGLLSLKADPRSRVDQHMRFDAKKRGESIPSINTDSCAAGYRGR